MNTETTAAWETYNAAVTAAGVTMREKDAIDDAVVDLVTAERAAVLDHLHVVIARPTAPAIGETVRAVGVN